jgi:voltage-gated potassium channel
MRWKRGERQPETIVPFEDLTPRERRAKIARSILTASVVSTLIILVYFGFPLTRTSGERSVILFVGSLALVGIVWIAQILVTLQSPYPSLRAIESLGTSVPLYLVTFAATHYLIEYRHAGSYSEPMTRLDALYFATTVFTTVGFGDIAPISERARVVTLLQMVGNLILIGLVARILLSAGQLRRSLAERTPDYRRPSQPPDSYDRGT